VRLPRPMSSSSLSWAVQTLSLGTFELIFSLPHKVSSHSRVTVLNHTLFPRPGRPGQGQHEAKSSACKQKSMPSVWLFLK
jgi:hypothetical protein